MNQTEKNRLNFKKNRIFAQRKVKNSPKQTNMPHQDYDKIFKENIAKIAHILLSKVCKLELENIESVKTTVPRTIERRADVLKMATDKRTGEKKLVHLELQSSNDPNMPWRMLVYKGLFYEIYQILNNLNEKTKNTKKSKKLNKYIFQLEILGNLRSLQSEITYQINNMTLDYDVRQDLRYLQGVEEADAKSAKVAEAKAAKTVLNLLSRGILTPIEIAAIVEMPLDFVLNIQNEMQQ